MGPDPGSAIRDPEKILPGSGSRIQGVKKHRIPDPGSGSATLESTIFGVKSYPSIKIINKVFILSSSFSMSRLPCRHFFRSRADWLYIDRLPPTEYRLNRQKVSFYTPESARIVLQFRQYRYCKFKGQPHKV
jgi:hypothetical protein